MSNILNDESMKAVLARLSDANRQFERNYTGDRPDRQPVHTVYGGAHLFKSDTVAKLGAAAQRSLKDYAPDAATLAYAVGLIDKERNENRASQLELANAIYDRVVEKLELEPIEDFRIDFEDGYGNRTDSEEDGHAESVSREVAVGLKNGTLPPFIGVRIKPLSHELHRRSLRTLDLFITNMVRRSSGALPPNFIVTLPKVTAPEHVTVLVDAFEVLEKKTGLAPGSLQLELMIETPQTIFGPAGEIVIPKLVENARGRCRGAHFGTYDYTAGLNITATHQVPSHPACDFARHMMQVCLASTGVTISDGATTVMPVGPHRAAPGKQLDPRLVQENVRAVHRAWRIHYDDVRMSLRNGYYQGWDLNPAQLPTRYAAIYAFFLESRHEAGVRLKAFVDKAAQATLLGNIFDDAATGQGLLNFFLRGINCGALTEQEALATGLTLDELRGRSFVKILNARRGVTS